MDLRAQLQSSLDATYAIERELGGGGMSRVFLATERALGRRVVIKVLSPVLAAEVSTKRFEREIRLAASLQQANIIPVLSAGETDGLPHYTMPFVDGLSLRERLTRDGRLPLTEAIAVLRDVARALSYAHEHGVVHRDIKPENVLLSGEAAVVTDFGIAKALAAAKETNSGEHSSAASTTALTGTGISLGTPAYMAPEQVAGDPAIDHRADLYSFGCVAYEVLTGTPPFGGRTIQSLLAAHIADIPPGVAEKRPECPPAIAQVISRCLAKDPGARPQSAREILRTFEGSHAPASGFTKLRQRLTQRQRVAVATIALTGVVIAGGWMARDRIVEGPPVVLAVLPFHVAGDSTDEYLADGIADGLATAIGKVHGLRIVSRSLSRQFRGKRDVDPREVGRVLAAREVLQGSLRRMGDRIYISAQLTNTDDLGELWSETYDRSSSDVLGIQEEITRAIVDTLRRRFGRVASLPRAGAGAGTANRDAYDLYMRGRFLLQRRGRGVRQSIEKFEQATALDSSFSRAYAALALALELAPYFEVMNTDSIGRRAIPAAQRALARDSSLAEAHTALALAYQHQFQWKLADASYRRAVAAGPDEVDVQIQYGRFLFYTGTVREALPHFERARALDPNSAVASGWVGHLLELSGRDSAAMIELRHALEVDSTNPPSLIMMGQAHLQRGNTAAARVYAERLWQVWPEWRAGAAALLAEMGDRDRARAVVADRAKRGLTFPAPSLWSALGDTTRMMEELERGTAARLIWPTYFSLNERYFDRVRGSARFAAIVRSVGLDDRLFTAPNAGRLR